MNSALLMIACFAGLVCSSSAEKLNTWMSQVGDNLYQTTATDEMIRGGYKEPGGISHGPEVILEPVGDCDLKQAIKLADQSATKLLGEAFTGKKPLWIMERAERSITFTGAYYYLVTYHRLHTANLNEQNVKLANNKLKVVVLFDGTVLPIEPAGKASEQRPHVRLKLRWKGATAERLAEESKPIIDQALLAVIDDEKATFYIEGDPSDVRVHMRKWMESLPKAMQFTAFERQDTSPPEPPKQQTRYRLHFSLIKERANRLGITAEAISKEIEKLGGPETEDIEQLAKMQSIKIKSPDGREIALKDVATIMMKENKRPLIYKN